MFGAVHELSHGAVLRLLCDERPTIAVRFPYLVTGSTARTDVWPWMWGFTDANTFDRIAAVEHVFQYSVGMSTGRLAAAHRLLSEAVEALCDAAGPSADADKLLSVLTLCEGVGRRLDRGGGRSGAARGVHRARLPQPGRCPGGSARVGAVRGPPPGGGGRGGVRAGRARRGGVAAEAAGHRRNLRQRGGGTSILVRLEDLENRARSAMLDFGGSLSPESLRMLACDAAVIPIVMNGVGQPLDVGRVNRTIPDGLRRAVAARDRGCAHPGCSRTASWCEIHHIRGWWPDGETKLDNLVMLCRAHHRLLHHSEWVVRIRDGLPEFVPPRWVDVDRTPRRKPLAHLAG